MSEIYQIDGRFLQPIISAYKLGLFDDVNLPPKVMNALDSLSEFDGIKQWGEGNPLPGTTKQTNYKKSSDYWNDPKKYRSYGHSTKPLNQPKRKVKS